MSSRSPGPSSIAVVAILMDGDSSVDHTLEGVAVQNYQPAGVHMIGGESKAVADALEVGWEPTLTALLDDLDPAVTHVWILRAGAVPGPGALYSLVYESERVGADVAGSKLLDIEHTGRLVSVGIATDVFDVPYVGLDDGELDAGQYDVVRDVAAVESDSLLVRRDLLKGLKGLDPAMAPGAASIDLSQRARALGARVVVVPSSEVAAERSEPEPAWREEAGRIRAMLKVYSPITLLWAVPVRFLAGLVEAILAPLAGRWTLTTWLRSWLWNLVRLPSTLSARRAARKAAVTGDAELFRFQLRGSASMRTLWGDLVDSARARFPEERSGAASLAQEVRRPAFGVALAATLFSLIGTRQIWSGFPAGGLSLPLPESGADAIDAYAGGWNPSGFGGTEQLPPFLGVAGGWQRLWFDNPGFASGSLIFLAFLGGIWGMTRLLRTWSVSSVPGILAGVAFMAGPAARTIAGSGDVANLVALGLVPWVARVALAPWPAGWAPRLGRVAAAAWMSGLLGNLSPDLLLLPLGIVVLNALLQPKEGRSWLAAAVAALGAGVGLVMMRPWIGGVDFGDYLAAGEAFWEPGMLLVVALMVAALTGVLAAPEGLWRIVLLGALAASAGALFARTASDGGGRHLEALALAAVAVGSALIVGAVFESLRRLDSVEPVGRIALAVGTIAAIVVTASSLLVVGPGRGGLPGDKLDDALRFTGASIDDNSAARVLLIGPPESLPGTSRNVRGAAYRVVSAPMPQLWEVELQEPGPADVALEAVLASIIDGDALRPGAQLSEFGIRWVVEMAETPLSSTMLGQLDLIPLDGLRRTVFLVDAPDAVRAVSSDGSGWERDGVGYAGSAADSVLVREHAHPGWGSDADPDDWAMTLDASNGSVGFRGGSESDQLRMSFWVGAVLAVLSLVSRRRR